MKRHKLHIRYPLQLDRERCLTGYTIIKILLLTQTRQIMKFCIVAFVLSTLVHRVVAQRWKCSDGGLITFRGSTTVFPVADKCSKKYAEECKGTTFNGGSGGSSAGARAACGDTSKGEPISDIGNLSRDFKIAEATPVAGKPGYYKCVAGAQREVIRIPVAIDGLTVFTERNGKAQKDCIDKLGGIGLSGKEIRWIYSNLTTLEADKTDIKNNDGNPATKTWNEISPLCPVQNIKAVGPSSIYGTHDYFKEILFTGGTSEGFRSDFQPYEDNSDALRDRVLNLDWSIGFLGYSYYDLNDASMYAIPVDGVAPSETSLTDGSYALFSRRIYSMYWNDENSLKKTKCFGDFTYTKIGQIVVESTFFVPIPTAEVDNIKALLPGNCIQPGVKPPPTPRPTRAPVCRCFFLFRALGFCCRKQLK
jgi:phosphate transport system substrate-binding protein